MTSHPTAENPAADHSNETIVPAAELATFVADLFEHSGLTPEDAQTVAQIFVLQEMRGIRTHGLRRVGYNLQGLKQHAMNPVPRRRVVKQMGAIAVLDGDQGVGMVGCLAAMRMAIDLARDYGLGMVTVTNNNHFLSAAPYCLEAVENDMIGIAFSNTQPSMGYPGTHVRAIGNSPLGFGVPTTAGYPLLFDAAMTTSGGKLAQYISEGRSVPENLVGTDAEGNLTLDPQQILFGGTPMPIGGYKGAGIALLVEVLTGVLSGGDFLTAIKFPSEPIPRAGTETQCCIAINIANFMEPAAFKQRMNELAATLKAMPVTRGYNEIKLPGERAEHARQAASAAGVSIPADVRQDLSKWATDLGVPMPF